MNILFYRYNSICERDIIKAFETLGHHVKTIDTEIFRKDVTARETLSLVHSELSSASYDFVFTINFYPVISEVCNIHHIRYLCWIVDSPVLELFSKSISNAWNRIFLFDSALLNDFSHYNPDRIFYLPLACDVGDKQSYIRNASTMQLHKFHHKISFIGSLYSEKNPYIHLQHSSEYMKGYLDAVMNTQQSIYGAYIVDDMITSEIIDYFDKNMSKKYIFPEKSNADYKALISQYYIGTNITVLERTHLLKELSKTYDVDLYTFSNTDMLPDIHVHNGANTITEMPIIFHESQINLNLTSRPIRNGIPLRIWDVLGCGGFLLTNYQNDLFKHLVPGEHLDIYSSEEEFFEKILFYSSHPDICRKIAHNGYEFLKKYHTYTIRCEELIQLAFSI